MAAVGEAKFKFECPGRGLSRVRWGSRAGRRALGALASAGPGAATRLGALPARGPGRGRAVRGAAATRGVRGPGRGRAGRARGGYWLIGRLIFFD